MESGKALRPCPTCGLAALVPADGREHPCGSCGAPMVVESPAEPEVPGLATSFRYPFSSLGSVLFLASAAPMWGLIRSLAGSMIAGLGEAILGMGGIFLGILMLALFGGYIAVWLWDVLADTAQGSDAPPSMPWPGDFAGYVQGALQFALAFAAAFGPALAVQGALGVDTEWKRALAGVLALAGTAYYPMALLLAGFGSNWTGPFRLPTGLRAIRVLGRDYALCVVLVAVSLGLTTALELAVELVWMRIGPWQGLAVRIVAVFLELAVYAAHMRAVGLVFRAHRKELGWVR